jgi:hypothetical protein
VTGPYFLFGDKKCDGLSENTKASKQKKYLIDYMNSQKYIHIRAMSGV